MQELPFSPRVIYLTFIISLCIALVLIAYSYLHTQTTVVFCDVGQGDGAYIRINNRIDVIIDAGPGRAMLTCLGRHMPFFDRKIEVAIITHPQVDHFGAFNQIIDRYQVDTMLLPPVDNEESEQFQELKRKMGKKTNVQFPHTNDVLQIRKSTLTFLWPTQEFITKHTKFTKKSTEVLGITSIDVNKYSVMFLYSEGDADILFTGDADPAVLSEVIESIPSNTTEVLKIPHHGSVNGLSAQFLAHVNPDISVISVGNNNRHGHPSQEILDLLDLHNSPYLRTDEEGDIVFEIRRGRVWRR